MQNTCRSPLVFVQGLPKCLQAFPQHSGLCLPQGWFPRRHHGFPKPGSRESAGEGPARHRHAQGHAVPLFLVSRPAETAEQAQGYLQGSEEGAHHLQTSEALLAPLAPCCHSWVSRASSPCRGPCPTLLSHLGRAETSPEVPPVPWGRAPNPHGADRGGGWTQHWKSLRAGVTQIHHCVLGAGT